MISAVLFFPGKTPRGPILGVTMRTPFSTRNRGESIWDLLTEPLRLCHQRRKNARLAFCNISAGLILSKFWNRPISTPQVFRNLCIQCQRLLLLWGRAKPDVSKAASSSMQAFRNHLENQSGMALMDSR